MDTWLIVTLVAGAVYVALCILEKVLIKKRAKQNSAAVAGEGDSDDSGAN